MNRECIINQETNAIKREAMQKEQPTNSIKYQNGDKTNVIPIVPSKFSNQIITRSLFSVANLENQKLDRENSSRASVSSGTSDFTTEQLADILNCCLPDSPEIKYR